MINSDMQALSNQDRMASAHAADAPYFFDSPGPKIERHPFFNGCGPFFQFHGCWFDLYKDMSRDELDVYGSILRPKTYLKETPLLTQGLPNHRLYFINKGCAKTVYLEDGAKIEGPDLCAGDIIGVESFFCGSPSRYTVSADRYAQIDFLDKDDVMDCFAYVPGLIMKLKSFCMKRKSDMDTTESTTYDKRLQKRYSIPGMTAAKLLDSKGVPVGKPFRGRLMDISKGGFAFSITLNEEKLARRLIGRSIVTLIKVQRALFREDVFWGGRIVQVRRRDQKDYSVHLKGDSASTSLTAMLNSLAG